VEPGSLLAGEADLESLYCIVVRDNRHTRPLNQVFPTIGHRVGAIADHLWQMKLNTTPAKQAEKEFEIGTVRDDDLRPAGVQSSDHHIDGVLYGK
jgi:hypothetical protein